MSRTFVFEICFLMVSLFLVHIVTLQQPKMSQRLLLLMLFVGVTVGFPTQPTNPIIGIVAEPDAYGGDCVTMYQRAYNIDGSMKVQATSPPGKNSCVWSIYVNWLQASGIRVLPIPYMSNDTTLDYLLQRVNGVIFPGGILSGDAPVYHQYYAFIQKIWTRVLKFNADGDPLVLWGTCQGFELVNALAADSLSVVQHGFVGTDPLMMAVNFTKYAPESKLYKDAPKHIIDLMKNKPTTANWHSFGVTPHSYETIIKLNSTLRPLSENDDLNGRTFVSSVEGRDAAIFAVQFHPERPMYDFTNDKIIHSKDAIEVSEWLSLFLLEQLRKNNHKFETPQDAEKYLIANYPIANIGYGIEIYYL